MIFQIIFREAVPDNILSVRKAVVRGKSSVRWYHFLLHKSVAPKITSLLAPSVNYQKLSGSNGPDWSISGASDKWCNPKSDKNQQ